MAIIALTADALKTGVRKYPIDDHGKLRYAWARVINDTAAAGDDGSYADFAKLPPGRKRLVPWLSRYKVSGVAFGAARVMKIGYRSYYDRSDVVSAAQVEDDDAFASGISVAAAAQGFIQGGAAADLFKYDIFSREEVGLFLTVTGGTWPIGSVIELAMAYLYE